MRPPKIIWTNKAKIQLKAIFDYYKENSAQAAQKIKGDILKATKSLRFAEQYQQDDTEPEFRRIIVRHYKILYLTEQHTIFIVGLFDTRQNPGKQKM